MSLFYLTEQFREICILSLFVRVQSDATAEVDNLSSNRSLLQSSHSCYTSLECVCVVHCKGYVHVTSNTSKQGLVLSI